MQKIPVIEASGSNYNIGFTIGRKLEKKIIRELIKIEEKNFKKRSGKSLSYYAKKVSNIIKLTEKFFPDYIEELSGMAKGAGIDFNTLFALGCEDDLVYGCTSIAGISKEGMIIGHNEDWLKDHINSLYICKIKQKDKPKSISLSYAGHLPGFSVGFNSVGLVYTGNSIDAKGINKEGLPWQFLTRGFLDAEKYGDLIKLVSLKNKMIGGNSLMVLKDKIFDLEFLPKEYAVIKSNKYLVHTNHILSEEMESQEKSHSKNSAWRLERVNELLKKNDFSFNLAKKILADHKHRPFSICCHEYEKRNATPYATMASIIVKLDKKEFYVAHGNPCRSGYKKYCL